MIDARVTRGVYNFCIVTENAAISTLTDEQIALVQQRLVLEVNVHDTRCISVALPTGSEYIKICSVQDMLQLTVS